MTTLQRFGWGILVFFALGIALYAFAYLGIPEMGAGALKSKLASTPLAMWAHVGGGGLALLIGAFQVHPGLRSRFLTGHRNLGKLYLIAVLFSGLAGLYLAMYAEGGVVAKLGFAGLAAAWLFTGSMAFIRIRRGDIISHRAWMIRCYALTLAAVTLRIYLPISLMSGAEFIYAYRVIAWMCWVPNLLVAEWGFVRRVERGVFQMS